MTSHRLWIVDHDAFNLGWLGSTGRLFAISRALQARDWQTTLVSARRTFVRRRREIERAFPGSLTQLPFPEDACPRVLNYPYIRTVWIRTHKRGSGRLVDDPELLWTPKVERWTQRQAAEAGRPDVIWAVSYGALRSPVVARCMSESLEVPLVVEFQDPCPLPGDEFTLAQVNTLEMTLRHASAIITTTSTYAEELRHSHPDVVGKVHVVYLTMPTPSPHAGAHTPLDLPGNATLTLLHPGSLYENEGRSANGLLAALPLFFEKRPEATGQVKLRFVGGGPGLSDIVEERGALSLESSVSVEGQVRPEEIRQEMAEADCLVLMQSPGPRYRSVVPGKLFGLLAAEKPILAILPEGEAATIVRESGLGLLAPPGDERAIADHLVHLWDSKVSGESLMVPVRSHISRFSQENMGQQLQRLFDSITSTDG
jgi:glycosyltransferase involved in cell wall biosynthesis